MRHVRVLHADPVKVGVVVAGILGSLTSAAAGQLQPTRLYHGIGRPIPVEVKNTGEAGGKMTLALLRPPTGERLESVDVTPGTADLATLYPSLWQVGVDAQGKAVTPSVRYVQLFVDEKPLGAPLVLQPLIDPPQAAALEGGQPRYRPSTGVFSGFRVYIAKHVILETSLGDIAIQLRPDAAPNTAWNFLHLAEGGFYTDIEIHRVRPKHPSGGGFVIQAGDPTQRGPGGPPASGEGGPGYTIDLEPSTLPHDFGVFSMARRQNLPNSAGSQFFICLSREGTSFLDGLYASFGQAVSGADVIVKLSEVKTDASDRPVERVTIRRARVVDAPPLGTVRAVTRPAASLAPIGPARSPSGVPRAVPETPEPAPPK